MKRITLILLISISTLGLFAQTGNFNYQAAVRDASGEIIKKFVVRECINFHPEQVPEEERSYIVY